MNTNSMPIILNKYSIDPLGQKILIINPDNGQSIVADKVYAKFLALIDNQRTLKDLLLEIHLQGYQIKLKELSRFFCDLGSTGILQQGGPENLGIFKFEKQFTGSYLTGSFYLTSKIKSNFYFGALNILFGFFILMSFFRIFKDFNFQFIRLFFQNSSVLIFSIYCIILGNCLLRAFYLMLASATAIGRVPGLCLHSARLLFFPDVNHSEIKGLKKNQQILVWLLAGLSPLVMYLFCSFKLQPKIIPVVFWICVFHTCFLLNPFRSSDFNRVLIQIVGPDEFYHLLPFLKTKAVLSIIRKKSKYISRIKLFLYGIFGFIWLTIVMQLVLMLFGKIPTPSYLLNAGGTIAQKLEVIQITILLFGLTSYFCFELITLLFTNLSGLLKFSIFKKNKSILPNAVLPTKISVVDKLKSIPFFVGFNEQQLQHLVDESQLQAYEKGHFAIVEGEPGNEMFVVLSGSFRLTKQLDTGVIITLTQLSENAIFGEIAVLEEVTRTADAEAQEDAVVLNIPRTAFHQLLDVESISSSMKKTIRERITLSRAMTQSRFFEDLPHELTELFFENSQIIYPKKDGHIIKKGELGQEFYIVTQGSVEILTAKNKITLKMGEFFGEISLLDNSRRSADVTANEGCVLMVIQAPDFFELIAKNWGLGINIEIVADLRKEGRI